MLQNTRLERNGRLSPKRDDNMNGSCVKTQKHREYEVSLSLVQIGSNSYHEVSLRGVLVRWSRCSHFVRHEMTVGSLPSSKKRGRVGREGKLRSQIHISHTNQTFYHMHE